MRVDYTDSLVLQTSRYPVRRPNRQLFENLFFSSPPQAADAEESRCTFFLGFFVTFFRLTLFDWLLRFDYFLFGLGLWFLRFWLFKRILSILDLFFLILMHHNVKWIFYYRLFFTVVNILLVCKDFFNNLGNHLSSRTF